MYLGLRVSSIVTIPRSISRFTRLRDLDLSLCEELREISRLPPSIRHVNAINYMSLDLPSSCRLLNQFGKIFMDPYFCEESESESELYHGDLWEWEELNPSEKNLLTIEIKIKYSEKFPSDDYDDPKIKRLEVPSSSDDPKITWLGVHVDCICCGCGSSSVSDDIDHHSFPSDVGMDTNLLVVPPEHLDHTSTNYTSKVCSVCSNSKPLRDAANTWEVDIAFKSSGVLFSSFLGCIAPNMIMYWRNVE
nr:hypothetical protein CFP56_13761 [Quercus suber]